MELDEPKLGETEDKEEDAIMDLNTLYAITGDWDMAQSLYDWSSRMQDKIRESVKSKSWKDDVNKMHEVLKREGIASPVTC